MLQRSNHFTKIDVIDMIFCEMIGFTHFMFFFFADATQEESFVRVNYAKMMDYCFL